MDPRTGMSRTVGDPAIIPELKRTIWEGVLQVAASNSVEELANEENEMLVGLLRLRPKASHSARPQ